MDFKITKGKSIICRRFIYVPNNITDFSKAYETIKQGFTADGIGTFKHKVKVSFDVSNDNTGEEFTVRQQNTPNELKEYAIGSKVELVIDSDAIQILKD